MKKDLLGVICALLVVILSLELSRVICIDNPIGLKFEPIETQIIIDKNDAIEYPPAEDFAVDYEGGTLTAVDITYDEAQMLMKIATAEAEIDGVEGMAMVMAVILARVKDERFPDTIEGVIFQEKQFSPIMDGRYYKAVLSAKSHQALAAIEMGKYNDVDALYFENAVDSWQSKNCEYLYTIGHHRFYKN